MRVIYLLILLLFGLTASLSNAADTLDIPEDTEYKPVEAPQGYISWDIFKQSKSKVEIKDDAEGFQIEITTPEFANAIEKLSDTQVKLIGYMFPLEGKAKHTKFLLGPYPLSCPFHYHVGPEQIVEVHLQEGIAFTYDPIRVTGTLKLIRAPSEVAMFHKLQNAKAIN